MIQAYTFNLRNEFTGSVNKISNNSLLIKNSHLHFRDESHAHVVPLCFLLYSRRFSRINSRAGYNGLRSRLAYSSNIFHFDHSNFSLQLRDDFWSVLMACFHQIRLADIFHRPTRSRLSFFPAKQDFLRFEDYPTSLHQRQMYNVLFLLVED